MNWRRPSELLTWGAVKELRISYYIGETILITIYTPSISLIKFLHGNPVNVKVKGSR